MGEEKNKEEQQQNTYRRSWKAMFERNSPCLVAGIPSAVILTDCVFWIIIVPILELKDYNLNFLIISMHTTNAVFLLGDTALNSLRFPWFRISYFILWTSFYVVFQWIVHASVSLWWPYPFLDLSSPFSPLWYVIIKHLLFDLLGNKQVYFFAAMVCVGGFDAHTMLRYFHVGNEDEVLSILKMVPSVLSVCDLIQIKSSWSVKYKELPRPQNNARSIGT
ncbi:hypothetical protein TEA_012451 [Camellia sinensis var. sinensis]|uniref:Uncharacterized protein n=1 Tax=Camellia sinensis var. sinensis TaxID=542762 RepID=A0A4S4EPT0_CAMSN|nr:hypothetical protein TEA_012451 [Camellia sinensis var. sinensis]